MLHSYLHICCSKPPPSHLLKYKVIYYNKISRISVTSVSLATVIHICTYIHSYIASPLRL